MSLLPTPMQCVRDHGIALTPWVREHLRVWVQAEGTVAERVDPDDTQTVLAAIAGYGELVEGEYLMQCSTDAVLLAMRREHEAQ